MSLPPSSSSSSSSSSFSHRAPTAPSSATTAADSCRDPSAAAAATAAAAGTSDARTAPAATTNSTTTTTNSTSNSNTHSSSPSAEAEAAAAILAAGPIQPTPPSPAPPHGPAAPYATHSGAPAFSKTSLDRMEENNYSGSNSYGGKDANEGPRRRPRNSDYSSAGSGTATSDGANVAVMPTGPPQQPAQPPASSPTNDSGPHYQFVSLPHPGLRSLTAAVGGGGPSGSNNGRRGGEGSADARSGLSAADPLAQETPSSGPGSDDATDAAAGVDSGTGPMESSQRPQQSLSHQPPKSLLLPLQQPGASGCQPQLSRIHSLTLWQQPKHSRMCGFGEKVDRRPVDPPPIIQLEIKMPQGSDESWYLYNPYYFMYATLLLPDSDDELHLLRDGKTRSTTGSIVSSLYRLKDVNNKEGAFFVFPDLSVRLEGRYRLKFSLFEIVNTEIYFCTSICSDVFHVYAAKKFPGMEESTFLSKMFAEQGLKIRIRKDVRSKQGRSKRAATDDEDSRPKVKGIKGSDSDADSASDDDRNGKRLVKKVKSSGAERTSADVPGMPSESPVPVRQQFPPAPPPEYGRPPAPPTRPSYRPDSYYGGFSGGAPRTAPPASGWRPSYGPAGPYRQPLPAGEERSGPLPPHSASYAPTSPHRPNSTPSSHQFYESSGPYYSRQAGPPSAGPYQPPSGQYDQYNYDWDARHQAPPSQYDDYKGYEDGTYHRPSSQYDSRRPPYPPIQRPPSPLRSDGYHSSGRRSPFGLSSNPSAAGAPQSLGPEPNHEDPVSSRPHHAMVPAGAAHPGNRRDSGSSADTATVNYPRVSRPAGPNAPQLNPPVGQGYATDSDRVDGRYGAPPSAPYSVPSRMPEYGGRPYGTGFPATSSPGPVSRRLPQPGFPSDDLRRYTSPSTYAPPGYHQQGPPTGPSSDARHYSYPSSIPIEESREPYASSDDPRYYDFPYRGPNAGVSGVSIPPRGSAAHNDSMERADPTMGSGGPGFGGARLTSVPSLQAHTGAREQPVLRSGAGTNGQGMYPAAPHLQHSSAGGRYHSTYEHQAPYHGPPHTVSSGVGVTNPPYGQHHAQGAYHGQLPPPPQPQPSQGYASSHHQYVPSTYGRPQPSVAPPPPPQSMQEPTPTRLPPIGGGGGGGPPDYHMSSSNHSMWDGLASAANGGGPPLGGKPGGAGLDGSGRVRYDEDDRRGPLVDGMGGPAAGGGAPAPSSS